MVRVDILLKNLQREYDITVGRNRTFDVSIDDITQSHDVYIYDLFDRQSIYGDELYPLILHLTQNNVEYLLEINLFPNPFLCGYDDRLLFMMDNDTLYALEHTVSCNYFPIKSSNADLDETIYADLVPQVTKLVCDDDTPISLTGTIDVQNQLALSTAGDLINRNRLIPMDISARLTDEITGDILNICYIVLNETGIHWLDGYLYEYDDMLLSAMDLTHPKMSLSMFVDEIVETMHVDLGKQISRLTSEVEIGTGKQVSPETSSMTLKTEADVTNTAKIQDVWFRSGFTNEITEDFQNTCEIALNETGIHWLNGYLYEYDDMLISEMDLTYPKTSLESGMTTDVSTIRTTAQSVI